ncbi:MAG: type IV pilus twitching motility protein PilT [Deltaproteobacteria bacterium]|nr:type IV pilus twitching motility protein PilT [Candidatus Anaeroferrophillacea bacterium]
MTAATIIPPRLRELLARTREQGSSDLHLSANMPPVLRIRGELRPLADEPVLDADAISALVTAVLPPRHREVLAERKSIDLGFSVPQVGRFRLAAYYQRGALSAVLRLLADGTPTFADLGLPDSLARLADTRDGLILVTGPTGSGKPTTLATLIDEINRRHRYNIITIEDPIEYVHENDHCVINQRELHVDVSSFADALRDALRADPDVILVGEMRDLETIRTAIMAAETGHLVFSTLHSRDCISTINRIVGVFSEHEQNHIRQQLSSALRAVVSQRLLPRAAGGGRVPAVEIMFTTAGIANLVRQGKDEMIYSAIETGINHGMQTMEQSLIRLIDTGEISVETGTTAARRPDLLQKRMSLRRK